MDTILKQLFNGDIFPAEQYYPVIEEYKELRKQQMNDYTSFIEKLDSPLDTEFARIMDEQLDTLPLDFFQMFADGFKLGIRMMIEVFDDKHQRETDE